MAYDEALADRIREVLAVRVDLTETETDKDLAGWVEAGADFAASLPPK